MTRLSDDKWPYRDEHCPKRGVGLTHIQDGSPECVYCHKYTRGDRPVIEDEETGKKIPFTDEQVNRIEFLRYLRVQGRL